MREVLLLLAIVNCLHSSQELDNLCIKNCGQKKIDCLSQVNGTICHERPCFNKEDCMMMYWKCFKFCDQVGKCKEKCVFVSTECVNECQQSMCPNECNGQCVEQKKNCVHLCQEMQLRIKRGSHHHIHINSTGHVNVTTNSTNPKPKVREEETFVWWPIVVAVGILILILIVIVVVLVIRRYRHRKALTERTEQTTTAPAASPQPLTGGVYQMPAQSQPPIKPKPKPKPTTEATKYTTEK